MRRLKLMVALAFLASVALFLSGCTPSPVYKTHYAYISPLAPYGFSCVRNCEADKSYCFQRAAQEKVDCEMGVQHQAQIAYQDYVTAYVENTDQKKKTLRDFIAEAPCNKDPLCVSAYQQCFIGCGGKVISHKACIKNCT